MPKKTQRVLKEWTLEYIKNKDLFTKSIKSIKQRDNKIIVEHTNKIHTYIIVPFIKDIRGITEKTAKKDGFISLVIFNSKENLEIIIKNWEELAKNQKFSIFFVNPFSSTEEKWIIYPSTHSRISSPFSLKKGLLALFATVEEIKEFS
jgi:hypothetical protein